MAASDDRWPIPLEYAANRQYYDRPPGMDQQVTLGDVDADGSLEVVQILPYTPYEPTRYAAPGGDPGARIEVLDLP